MIVMTGHSRSASPPWSWRQQDELMARLRAAYEELERPRRAFASKIELQKPYRELVSALESMVRLTDDTDLNEDVCFRYIVNVNGDTDRHTLFLRLSMVGPYAMFEREVGDRRMFLISTEADCPSVLERAILRLLIRHGLMLMSEAHLAFRVHIKLPGIENPTAYNALFEPEEQGSR